MGCSLRQLVEILCASPGNTAFSCCVVHENFEGHGREGVCLTQSLWEAACRSAGRTPAPPAAGFPPAPAGSKSEVNAMRREVHRLMRKRTTERGKGQQRASKLPELSVTA